MRSLITYKPFFLTLYTQACVIIFKVYKFYYNFSVTSYRKSKSSNLKPQMGFIRIKSIWCYLRAQFDRVGMTPSDLSLHPCFCFVLFSLSFPGQLFLYLRRRKPTFLKFILIGQIQFTPNTLAKRRECTGSKDLLLKFKALSQLSKQLMNSPHKTSKTQLFPIWKGKRKFQL